MWSEAPESMIHGAHIFEVQLREVEVLKLPVCAREPLGIPDKELDFSNLISSSTCSLLKVLFSAS